MTAPMRLSLLALVGAFLCIGTATAQSPAFDVEATYAPQGTPVTHTAFQVNNDGAFIARGFVRDVGNTTGCAAFLPATGAGTRFMWLPCRGSVRWGRVPTAQANWDDANMDDFTFAAGNQVTASGYGAFAFGDQVNVTSTVGTGFGSGITVTGTAGFSAGASNRCSGFACVALGYTVKAGGQGSVALGYRATALNDNAVTIGYRGSNNGHIGTIVLAAVVDPSTQTDSVRAQADGEFRLRAAGGIRLRSSVASNSSAGVASNTGCDLAPGSGTWSCSSSRTIKTDFLDVDAFDFLARLRALPVTTWSYTGEGNGVRHLGPVAEDWWAAFQLGEGETAVGAQDLAAAGIVGVQALAVQTDGLAARVAELEAENTALREERAETEARLARLEARLAPKPPAEAGGAK